MVVVELIGGCEDGGIGDVDSITTVGEFNGNSLVVWLENNITVVVCNTDALETGFTVVKLVFKVVVTKDEFDCDSRECSVVFIAKLMFSLGLFSVISVVLVFEIVIV